MAGVIFDSHTGCCFAFEDLIDAIQHPVRDFRDQLPLKDVQEEFSKYKIWAGNVGATNSGKGYEISLDYSLREASFVRDSVLGLLKTLHTKLENATLLLRGKRSPFEEQTDDSEETTSGSSPSEADEEEDAENSPWDISSSSSGDSNACHGAIQPAVSFGTDSGLIAKLGQTPSHEMPRLLASISFVVICLHRISIRRPASLDRFKDKTLIDSSSYQQFDMLYVKDKFPLLDPDVATRLGKMITRRRQLLYYRRADTQSLHTAQVEPELRLSLKLPETGATTAPQKVQSEGHVALNRTAGSHYTLDLKATTLQSEPLLVPSIQGKLDSMTLCAPLTSESETSMISSFTGKDTQINIPPRPTGDNGEALKWFECPYCLITKHIATEHRWK
jgi:hypothetical protein